MDTAQRLEEVFAKKPGADELMKRLTALPQKDQLGCLYFLVGAYQATTYAEWANFHGLLSQALDDADKAAAIPTP